MSKITISYDKKDYVLEYSRQSVRTMEAQGFVLDDIAAKPMMTIPMLFQGAFIKNHRGIKRNLMDEIYEEINNKTDLITALMEMYTETLSTLMDDKADAGNATWAMTK